MNLSEAFFFALCFGSSHSRMEVSPHAIRCQSACFHYSANNTLVVCASQQAQYRASNLFICGEKGQANTLALMLEVLYLSTDPDIWVVQPRCALSYCLWHSLREETIL